MLGDARRLARAAWGRAPGEAARALGLAALANATRGAAALLLVPLLRLAGVPADAGAAGRVARAVDALFSAVDLRPSLAAVLGLYVLAAAAQAAAGAGAQAAAARVDHAFVRALRARLYAAVTGAAWPAVARARGSDVAHALTADADRVGEAVAHALHLANDALAAAAYVTLAALVSPAMTLVAAACGLLLLAATRGAARAARAEGEALGGRGAELQAAAQEHVAGLKAARSFGADARSRLLFEALAARVAAAAVRTARRGAASAARFEVGAAAALAVLLYAALAVLRLPTATVLLLLVLFGRVVPAFAGLQQEWQAFAYALPAYGRVAGMAERFEAAAEPAAGADGAGPELARELRLDDVWFAYPGRAEPVLRGLSLRVGAGELVALVGPSGAGKSTAADLVLGLLRPDAGAVVVDGAPLGAERLGAWRARTGYVAQDVFLLHDTVRANLWWARPGADDAALWEALALADAAEFVRRLPGGLDAVVGDRGATLSGGERQRLALARALLRRPALLVLDEATTALDAESERRILAAVAALRGRTTVLVVTHRAGALERADRVYALEGGRAVVRGGAADPEPARCAVL